ncbi:hypothetical protein [Frankia sp. CcI156]|nr:hypothetical protein [Frankia sp. CcI156]
MQQAAERAGNSPAVIWRTYARLLDGGEQDAVQSARCRTAGGRLEWEA